MTSALSAKDAEFNALVADWQSGGDNPAFSDKVNEWAGSLTGYCRKGNAVLRDDDDLPGAATVWVLERLHEWRTGEGTASGWLASGFRMFLSGYVQARLGQPSKSWNHVSAAAAAIRQEAVSRGEVLTLETWHARTAARLLNQVAERVAGAHPDWEVARVRFEARALARKNGLLAALNQFAEIVALDGAPIRLDQPVASDGEETTFGGILEADDVDVHAEEHVQALVRVMLGDDADWARTALAAKADARFSSEAASDQSSYQGLAAEAGHTAAELQAVLKLAKPRARAPHAQWAYLSAPTMVTVSSPASLFADA